MPPRLELRGERSRTPETSRSPPDRGHRSRSQPLRTPAATNPSPEIVVTGTGSALDIFIRRAQLRPPHERNAAEGKQVLLGLFEQRRDFR
jgi:hypothetical protein